MKNIIRVLIIGVLSISLAFAATFPKGIISLKNGTEIRVKRVSIRDNFVYYKLKGDQHSALLEDVNYVKAKGKVEQIVGGITGGASLLFLGAVYSRLPSDMDPDGKSLYLSIGAATAAVAYAGSRLVGSIFDPWRKIYTSPAQKAVPGE